MLSLIPKLYTRSIGEVCYIDGVNIFEFCKKENERWTPFKFAKIIKMNGNKSKSQIIKIPKFYLVKGENCEFKIGIYEFAFSKYLIFFSNEKEYLRVFNHALRQNFKEDEQKNNEHIKNMAMTYSINNKNEYKFYGSNFDRVVISKREDGTYNVDRQTLDIFSFDEIAYSMLTINDCFWSWNTDSSLTICDTFENAQKLAKEKLGIAE